MKKIKTILAILPALLFSCAGDDVEKYIPPTSDLSNDCSVRTRRGGRLS